MELKLGIKLFAWSIAILVVSVLVLTFRGLYSLELRYIDLVPTKVFMNARTSQSDSPVREFSFWSMEESPEQYFKNIVKITARLKKAGARVIVVPIPPTTTLDPKIQNLVRAVAANDRVVFGSALTSSSSFQDGSEKKFDAPDNWWVSHPMNNLIAMDWGVSSVRANNSSTLFRFIPNQYRETMKSYIVPDVALRAARKFASVPDSVVSTRHFDAIYSGPFRMPLWKDGFAYVKASVGPYLNSPIYASISSATDSLKYGGQWIGGREQPITDSTWAKLSGKIVVIDWPYMTVAAKWRWMSYGRIYTQIIDAILTNRFVHRYNQWDLALVFVMIMLAAALVFSVRTPWAVIVLIVAHGAILFSDVWLFASKDILHDPTYILFALIVCTMVLPIVKVSHERGFFKKQFENSEEHVAMLEGRLKELTDHNRTI